MWPDEIKRSVDNGDKITFEMYNNTFLYVRPKGASNRMELDFWIYQTAMFRYGSKYSIISILISGVGGVILILSVILYLDGFCALYRYILEQRAERERFAKEEAQLKKNGQIGANGALGGDKKLGKKGEQDTQKSIDEYSEEDGNFIAPGIEGNDHPAIHEGGREQRPGSNGSVRRNNMVHEMDQY